MSARRRKRALDEGPREKKIELDDLKLPAQFRVGNYVVILREKHKAVFPWGTSYIVACQLKDGDWTSHVFHVYCDNVDDFKQKILNDIKLYEAGKAMVGEEVIRKV